MDQQVCPVETIRGTPQKVETSHLIVVGMLGGFHPGCVGRHGGWGDPLNKLAGPCGVLNLV